MKNEQLCGGNPCDEALGLIDTLEHVAKEQASYIQIMLRIADSTQGLEHDIKEDGLGAADPEYTESRLAKVKEASQTNRRHNLNNLEAIDDTVETLENLVNGCRVCPGLGDCALQASSTEPS